MDGKRALGAAVIGAALFLSLVAATCGSTTTRVEDNGSQPTGITVSGTGRVSAKPDIVQITLGVSTLRPTVRDAREAAATALDAMIGTMKANGVADRDIQTQQFNISAEYDYEPASSKQVLRGFRVTNVVSVKLRDIDKTSQVVDDAVLAGGDETQIQGINFTIDKPDDLKQEARAAAVADAKAKADTLAGSAGVGVGAPTLISESNYSPPVYDARLDYAQAASAAPSAPTPIQPGELDVTVDVSVTFAIE